MTRLASALLLIAVIVATLWWLPSWATLLLVALVAVLAGAELARMAGTDGASVPAGFLSVLALLGTLTFALDNADQGGDLIVVMLLTAVIGIGAVVLGSGPPAGAATRAGVSLLAVLYVGVPLGALAAVQAVEGPAALTLLLLIVAGSDTAQYYTGRKFGRRKLAPVVSPGKTVEGAAGGLVVALVVGAVAAPRLLAPESAVTVVTGALLGFGLASVGLVGDLFESTLKRGADVKDSSTLIPGHGGVLDRIDSYLFAAPAYFIYLRFIA